MSLRIAVPKTTAAHERRAAASPDTVKKLAGMGCTVTIEAGAGTESAITDEMFKEAGAKIAKNAADTLKNADIVLCVQAPSEEELKQVPKGAILIGMLAPYNNSALNKSYAKTGVTALSMELMPRITRAQSMDVLSSQSNLAGYKAVLDACEVFGRALPMMMTAAGTVPPARVFVMGAGVAGLQAIATAKRLGAVVSATDVRPAAKEQVESLGGKFVAVEDEEFKQAETAGGYAKEMSKEYRKKQAALIRETIAKQDIIITTALIPGRPAPELISGDMVASMKPGSVIVDLAVEQGGNCALSKAGSIVEKDGVKIIGHHNVPSRLAASSSALYAKNLLNLLNLLIDQESGKLSLNWDDDIIKGIALTKDGAIIHPAFTGEGTGEVKKPASKKATAKKTATKKTTVKKKPAVKKTPTTKAKAKTQDDKK